MIKVILKRKIASRIANGHPWIFNNEINNIEGAVTPGDIVDVYFADGSFAGRGYINPQSQIAVRLLTRKKEEINDAFFYNRILKQGQHPWLYLFQTHNPFSVLPASMNYSHHRYTAYYGSALRAV